MPAGVHHYRPDRHCLEQRAAAPFAWSGGFLVALTGIHWREAWKYGMRAFRYCQHDCGHALAALSYAAAALGWPARLLDDWGDEEIAALTGVDRADDFAAAEAEAPEAVVWIGPGDAPAASAVLARLARAGWAGQANVLSSSHRDWPDIAAVATATGKPAGVPAASDIPQPPLPTPPALSPASREPVSRLIRRRRSAQAFDGVTAIGAERFYRMLDALLPRAGLPPWSLLDHGAIACIRCCSCIAWSAWNRASIACRALRRRWLNCAPRCARTGFGQAFPIARRTCRCISWRRWTRGSSPPVFPAIRRSPPTPPLHWPCWRASTTSMRSGPGAIADASGRRACSGRRSTSRRKPPVVQGTGIGCYFDDAVHEALGLDTARFQDLYHFTVGKAVIDARLGSEPAYAHLAGDARRRI